MKREIVNKIEPANIDGLIPGVRGQRPFPNRIFQESDPFVMLDHIGPQKVGDNWKLDGEGHDHPHRGFETLTFMFEGVLNHRDSLGNHSTINSGSIQRMNAGSGIIHGGSMESDLLTKRFHEIQLWVNNPASEKMSVPNIHNVANEEFPTIETENIKLRIVSGTLNAVSGPIKTKAETNIGHLIGTGQGSLNVNGFADFEKLMVYVLEGEVKVNNEMLKAFELINFSENGDSIEIETSGNSQLLILSGKPLNEPVVYGGPFVMNSEEEVRQAELDYRNGLFQQKK